MLLHHYLWKSVYSNLEFVVIDEIHAYRGVLGSHVANVFRRLNRLSIHYQDKLPRYICNSATVRNPVKFAEKLTGMSDFVEIARSGSPSPEKIISVVNNISDYQLIDFIVEKLKDEVPTLIFIDNRKGIEILYLNVIDKLKELGLDEYVDKVKTYRAGYQEHERREIENALANKDALVVLSTAALEMGIDIGEVECVVVKGFPGTLAALWQRFGRAGRRGRTAFNYFIVGNSAIDQYYLKNPEEILHKEVEEPVISPSNKEIFKKHLIAMANELPLTEEDILKFNSQERQVLNQLLLNGSLIMTRKGVIASKDINPFFAIRSIGGVYKIIDIETNRPVGELSEDQVFYEGYIGTIYIHLGNKYKVVDVDKENKIVYVEKGNYNYYTKEIVLSTVEPILIEKTKRIKDIEIRFGDVKVSSKIDFYKKVEIGSGKSLEVVRLKEPVEKIYNTKAFWITLPYYFEEKVRKLVLKETVNLARSILEGEIVAGYRIKTEADVLNALDMIYYNTNLLTDTLKRLTREDAEILQLAIKRYKDKDIFKYGLYGVENAITSIFPIFAMNDKRDIDSASDADSSYPAIFIFDAYEGGLGYAEVGFERIEEILDHAYKNVKNCSCIAGCPACVLSYKHEDVDKLAAEIILRVMSEER
jgi:DEAD/DEAH box helicase domain-containing protein